ncbi:hypothetical protein ACIQRW_07005 [Streptomyces sp. NPDC091287]|uniref:hypothetical protein n=1 Tax=Streptomyces sp. NPDC091287 TaxID=3365988 RepID=UPI00381D95FD
MAAATIDGTDFDRALVHAELDARPWASYTHAYGSAEDVPGCLRALAGDDAFRRPGRTDGAVVGPQQALQASVRSRRVPLRHRGDVLQPSRGDSM